ncbi:PIR Superfamily Protein [Plasmodium ovale curtisi]|uniref:PIR Superfamily Protein n=1 Tax=Plasmodium ovale curtisi TaxID=864141 RepID=A0A1A8WLV4_PLAOA|nr:PIR Superfamily Protein [Plasmodium ovale curtisi]SBT02841.1 PIR Superfamily Protein [Plasmodium ovale curtisi]
MVNVTFQITDDSEHNRNEKCFELLADIQSAIYQKLAEFNRTQHGDAKFVQICQELGKYLDSHDEDIKDCYEGKFTYIYEYIKSYFQHQLAKSTNYINCIDKLTSERKEKTTKILEAEEALKTAEAGRQVLKDPVKEDPAKPECDSSPCNTEHSGNQAMDGRNQDNLGKDGEANAHHGPGSSELGEMSDKLVPSNSKSSESETDGVRDHTDQEGTKSSLHVARHQEVGKTYSSPSVPLQDRTNEGFILNGETHAHSLEKGIDLSVDAPGIMIIAQKRLTSAIYLNAVVTKVHEPQIDKSNHTLCTNLSGTYFNLTPGESTLTVPHPSIGEEATTDLSSSHGVSPYSQNLLPGGISSASEKNSLDSLPLSVSTFPVVQVSSAEQQLTPQVRLPSLESTSDHEREPQNKSSKEQINSQGSQLNEINVDGMDEELSTHVQEQQTTSIKTYLIIILASLGAMLLSILLIKFTSLGAYFRRKKNEKRQKMREELDRIMYTPSNFEKDNIYLSYSQPKYSFYDAEYDN